MSSLSAFERESINTVVHIPDYKLRRQLSLQVDQEIVVEAFTAHDDLFFLHISWEDGRDYPMLSLSSLCTFAQKTALELTLQSPHFSYAFLDADTAPNSQPPCVPCIWSTNSASIVEVLTSNDTIPLQLDRSPSYHNERGITLVQTVTFTLTGTMWKLDSDHGSSLQCRTYRVQAEEAVTLRRSPMARMVQHVAKMQAVADVEKDIRIMVDDEAIEAREAHSFILQAQSPVLLRMLVGPMKEAKEKSITMAGVTASQLDDFLAALYNFGIPPDVLEDEERLLALLEISDRYEVEAIRDECATVLEGKLHEGNMTRFLEVADRHQISQLRSTVLEFAMARLERVAAVMDSDHVAVRTAVRQHLTKMVLLRGDRLREKAYHTDASPLVLTV